jgi:hypothetical protein
MSLINATIFIQAANFGITYLLVRHLLLKPVVATIQEETENQQQLLGQLTTQKLSLASSEQELDLWRNWCRKEFSQRAPNPEQIFVNCDYKLFEQIDKNRSSSYDLNEQEKALTKAIIKKVMHVKL